MVNHIAYGLLEQQESKEEKVGINLEVTEELLQHLNSVGVKYTVNNKNTNKSTSKK